MEFRLPGEAQKIDRLMESFAAKYIADNPNSNFPSTGKFLINFLSCLETKSLLTLAISLSLSLSRVCVCDI